MTTVHIVLHGRRKTGGVFTDQEMAGRVADMIKAHNIYDRDDVLVLSVELDEMPAHAALHAQGQRCWFVTEYTVDGEVNVSILDTNETQDEVTVDIGRGITTRLRHWSLTPDQALGRLRYYQKKFYDQQRGDPSIVLEAATSTVSYIYNHETNLFELEEEERP